MTREDLVDWLKANGCEQEPISGINVTGHQIKFVNKKTNKYTYIDTPIDDREVPEYAIAHICDKLFIKSPDCVAEQKPLVDGIKARFSPKGK